MNRAFWILLAAGQLVLGPGPAGAAEAPLPAPAPRLIALGPAKPLRGWLDLCRRNPDACALGPAGPDMITLAPALWTVLVQVNAAVNHEIEPVTDKEHWGISEHWDLAEDGKGDCEDYQLLKRKRLIDKGFPRRALRMTVVLDGNDEGHAVLVVRTDRGDYVLDNETSSILPWSETGYAYIRQEGSSGTGWVSLGGVNAPAVTARAAQEGRRP
ncbi:transglutaminase [Alsobacter soli]|uniref:Transglutaminase n=1 Tax=Alsobacter soli TaxID=2109933 RepID=A0A2T1HLG9_9HYPH|nr:transglutaminase-like cysteine peptidase [Alsobacter soli]PSC02490.1 transglutaminase [Alsobacter soli]